MPWMLRRGVRALLLAGVAIGALYAVIAQLPEIRRYIRIRSM